jgi:peptide-methionine (R)-S-oxide reductase
MSRKIQKTDAEWRQALTPEQYRILREKGTEPAFTGAYYDEKGRGVYRCAACSTPLFTSDEKYDSGSGWPSFYDAVDRGNIALHEDRSLGMQRIEATCATCGGHLGHVFPDGPPDKTGLRYCINSAALTLDRDMDPDAVK